MTDRRARRDGFTLVEMLVAMAVFGLSAMALLNLAGENTRSAARVESRTLGGVVADNLVVEAVIAPSLSDGVSNGRDEPGGPGLELDPDRGAHRRRRHPAGRGPGVQ